MAKKKETTTGAGKAKKTAAPADASVGVPRIDTDLAAAAAAKALAAGLGTGASGTTQPQQESSAFKQLKAGLNKPSFGANSPTGNLLGGIGGIGKKSNQPFTGGKQIGRNQTFGADVNRTGVPRRTSGG
jgi:hypothetical protein